MSSGPVGSGLNRLVFPGGVPAEQGKAGPEPHVLRMTNQQVDLLAQRIAYWSNRRAPWDLPRGQLTFKATVNITTGAAPARILSGNPLRRGVLFANRGSNIVTVWPDATLTNAGGFTLTASGGFLDITYERHGELAANEWFAISALAASLSLIEILAVRSP